MNETARYYFIENLLKDNNLEQPKFDKMTSLLSELKLRIMNDVLCKGSTPLTPDEFDEFVEYAVKNYYVMLRDYGDGWLPSGFKSLIEYQRHSITQELILYASSKYYGQITTKDTIALNKPTVPACSEPSTSEVQTQDEDAITQDDDIKIGAVGPSESDIIHHDDNCIEEFMTNQDSLSEVASEDMHVDDHNMTPDEIGDEF